jgi:hypothetical protein
MIRKDYGVPSFVDDFWNFSLIPFTVSVIIIFKLNTGVFPSTYAFLFRNLSILQVHHLHLKLVFRHFV